MQYGHFDNDRREYVIDRVDLPASWTNYLGTEEMCAVVNHTAGGYLFHKSAEYHRITRFRANAVPMDRPGHYIYLRDDDTGEYWSVSWQPVGKPLDWAKYTCRHGLSYTKYECEYGGIHAIPFKCIIHHNSNKNNVHILIFFPYRIRCFHPIHFFHSNVEKYNVILLQVIIIAAKFQTTCKKINTKYNLLFFKILFD